MTAPGTEGKMTLKKFPSFGSSADPGHLRGPGLETESGPGRESKILLGRRERS